MVRLLSVNFQFILQRVDEYWMRQLSVQKEEEEEEEGSLEQMEGRLNSWKIHLNRREVQHNNLIDSLISKYVLDLTLVSGFPSGYVGVLQLGIRKCPSLWWNSCGALWSMRSDKTLSSWAFGLACHCAV